MSGRKKKPLSMVEIYLNYKTDAIRTYGKYAAVLMQVGSFYELYEIDNDISDPSSIGCITELMGINLTIRGGTVPSYQTPWFAGVPMDQIEKFSQRLTSNGYRVVLVSHTGTLDETNRETRAISRILSAGTTLTPGTWDANWILTIYLEGRLDTNVQSVDIGISLVDVSTGEVQVAEFISKLHDIYAELHKIIHAKNPCELVLFLGCKQDPAVFIREAQLDKIPVRIYDNIPEQVSKSSYRKKLLEKVHGPLGAADLWKKPLGTIAYVGTIFFCSEHYSQLINELDEPILYESERYMSLYNNALNELDIWHEHSKKSLFNIITFTHTAMGTRLLKERLVQPITDAVELQKRYVLIRRFIENKIQLVGLKDLVDLKRYHRRLYLGSIPPTDVVRLDRSYTEIDDLFAGLNLTQEEQEWFGLTPTIKAELKEMIQYYRSVFILEKMSGVVEIDENLHHKGVSPILDKMQLELEELRNAFANSAARLTGLLLETAGGKKTGEVSVEFKDKFGYYLSTTRTRFNKIRKHPDCIINGFYIDEDTQTQTQIQIQIQTQIQTQTQTQTKTQEHPDSDDEDTKKKVGNKQGKVRITSAVLKQASAQIILLQEQFRRLGREVYLVELRKWSERYKLLLEQVSNIVAAIDFAHAGALMAKTYGYVEPTLHNDQQSFITATNLRHPIVERLVRDVQYIGNDISLNSTENTGIILYGLNGGGKTVLSKSVAVNLIMAQAGLYVAATTFEYAPYTKLFTRIGGTDNMFNGESSFTLEMNELRSILKYADNRSLMIGDEICKGTEPVSAMAIVGAAVQKFASLGVQFIFATHLHKLVDLKDIASITNVSIKHLHVEVTEDNLIYHRKLRDGPGPGLYGLEVMQFLIKDLEFKGVAQRIRNEVLTLPDLPLNVKRSRYNPELFVHSCEVCGVPYTATPLDVHHIRFQCTFEDGPIDAGLHKDQLSNLVVLCKKHHQDVHTGSLTIQGWQDTINGRKLAFKGVVV